MLPKEIKIRSSNFVKFQLNKKNNSDFLSASVRRAYISSLLNMVLLESLLLYPLRDFLPKIPSYTFPFADLSSISIEGIVILVYIMILIYCFFD